MLVDWLLLAALALGHAGLVVLAVNTFHALGIEADDLEVVTLTALGLLGVATLAVGWSIAGTPWSSWPWPVRLYAIPCLATALVGLPAVTLARALRGRPAGIAGASREVDLAPASDGRGGVGTSRLAWLLRLPGNESLRLRRSEWRVELAGLPRSLEGLSIAHLTDLHFSRAYDRGYFEAVADAVAAGEPDLVAFTGDLVDDDAAIDWIVPVLSRVRGRLGQFAILGNHDRHHQPDRVARELERAGFAVLDGRWARLDVGGATLAVGGTSAPWGPALDPAAMPEADLRLLLCHSPDWFYRAEGWGIDLMLSGHNHGGQVRLPVVGPVLMPSRYSRRFDQGFFRRGRMVMYVGPGVGAKHPIRYGCPPEVSRLELCAAPVAERDGAWSVGGPTTRRLPALSGPRLAGFDHGGVRMGAGSRQQG
jgi:uncharacterized protein